MSIIHVISVSSGKDSQATMLIALERFGVHRCRFVFADTGNEDQAVYDHLAYLEHALDIQIDRLKADFSEQIASKRTFIARDRRHRREYETKPVFDALGNPVPKRDGLGNIITKKVKRDGIDAQEPVQKTVKIGGGHKVRWTNKAKRRALAVLHPTGIPFLDLCLWKGRFPSRKAQFCTEQLKTIPLVEYQMALIDQGNTVVSWQGVRRDESHNRRNALSFESMGGGMYIYRPIAGWTAQKTVDFSLSRGLLLNPLYSEEFDRVGCMLCINSGKEDISNAADRKPLHIARLASWEPIVGQASKRGGSSFFPNTKNDPIDKPNIYAVVQWAKTSRGGRQTTLFAPERPACASSYGLCE
jgi:3'-phosphoadenosine 5'-phosphosulfate sulfotransferase (PAPS reductase)/FAD synthetase